MNGVIFDLDGTLIDSAPDIHRIANEVLADERLGPLSLAQVRSFIGNGVAVFIERVLAAHGLPGHGDQHGRMVAAFSIQYETGHELTTLYPGIREALADLERADCRLGLCTNKPEAPTRAVLAHFDLDRTFPVIVGGDSLPRRKPDPAPLLYAARELGVERPLFVGDSEVDAETARRAALPFALFTGGYRRSAVADIPHALAFDSWSGFAERIGEVGARL